MLDVAPPPLWMPERPALVRPWREAGVFASPIFESPVFGGKAAGIGGNDSYTKLLLHFGGSDASTTFTDSSASAHSITRSAPVEIDTAQSKFGGSSGLWTGGYLQTPNSTDFAWSTGDYTIDFWVRFNTVANFLYMLWRVNGTTQRLALQSQNFDLLSGGSTVISGTTTAVVNTWYHVAIARSGSSTKLFVNGTQEGSTWSASTDFGTSAVTAYIGSNSDANWRMDGWFDEYRVSKGIARWTANFTPPTQAYS